jgi:hypothetical protein
VLGYADMARLNFCYLLALIIAMKGQKPRGLLACGVLAHSFSFCISGNVLMIRARDHFVALPTRAGADRSHTKRYSCVRRWWRTN